MNELDHPCRPRRWLPRGALARLVAALSTGVLVACGGGGGSEAPDRPPTAVIDSPVEGATFRAGDSITFSGRASDDRDGTLPASALTWWAELHHDTHTHPFQQPTQGGSGTVTIPTRGETSDNIFYRFHLRAIDSAGQTTVVTRDVQPRKARVTLATTPPGLQLTLDGQNVTGPFAFTGVVGIERDLGAPLEQASGGRRWAFAAWSQGGTRAQTIATPASDTTYTASFTDVGPVANQPPQVTLAAPSSATLGDTVALGATASDADGRVVRVEFRVDGALVATDTSAPFEGTWTPTQAGAYSVVARAVDDQGASTDSVAVPVAIRPPAPRDTTPPTITITAPGNLADNLAGTVTVTADASDNVGVAGVEFQVDGAAVGSEDTSAPYSIAVDTTLWASGQHVLRARARDAAGNVSPWASALVRFGGTRSLPAGFTRTDGWVSGLASATAFAQAADGRMFVAQQGGALRIVKNGALLATPFVTLAVDSSGERGLIGVTTHPDFTNRPYVYVYYTRINGGARNNRLSRFLASADFPGGPEEVLLDLPNLSTATNHNGGALKFGADGKLYVAVGDNANSATPQNPDSVFGKMLRVNDDGSVPADNPFASTRVGQARTIWASGLRNPFTFAVQPGTGRLHINDVGQNTWEEINLGVAGANYGWPASEGPDNITAGVTAPLFAYKHFATAPPGSGPGGFFTGAAIAGGAFYPASGPFPAALRGKYFFADFVDGFIGVLDTDNGNAAYAFGRVGGSPVDMFVGADGALYVLTRGSIVRFTAP